MSDKPATDGSSNDDSTAQDQSATKSVASETPERRGLRKLRVWPAMLLLAGMWTSQALPSRFEEMSPLLMMVGLMGPLLFTSLILLWWVLLSRASWVEKGLGLLGLILLTVVANMLADKSVQGFGIIVFAIPTAISVFTVALVLIGAMESRRRTWIALLATLVCFAYWDLVRTDEIWGNFHTARSWRWEPTAEDRFLETLAKRSEASDSAAPTATPDAATLGDSDQHLATPEWPAFRGPQRRGVQAGIVLDEDWQAHPPRELWRVPIGPGWSSFSVAGDRLFTQEQRGDQEVVSCYDADTGEQVWIHQDKSRFWEPVGGAGPRGTPTLHNGMLFALGAQGLLNRLDPITGEQVWQQDIHAEAGREPPQWGYASSPLVADDVVIVHAGGPDDMGLLAYDLESGELRWSSPAGDHSYSSPQLSDLGGKTCVLMLTNQGLTFVDPSDGAMLGKYDWKYGGYRVVQPLVLDDSSVLVGTPMGMGTQRIDVSFDGGKFSAKKRWETNRMNPYYNDYVAHDGALYGFDNNIFACVDLDTGQRQWKQGRYGNGQVLLLPDGNQLLVISEDGELVLLRATPEKHDELARHQVLDGRTWNHPVLIGNRLYVRNAEEAACFEMTTSQGEPLVP